MLADQKRAASDSNLAPFVASSSRVGLKTHYGDNDPARELEARVRRWRIKPRHERPPLPKIAGV